MNKTRQRRVVPLIAIAAGAVLTAGCGTTHAVTEANTQPSPPVSSSSRTPTVQPSSPSLPPTVQPSSSPLPPITWAGCTTTITGQSPYISVNVSTTVTNNTSGEYTVTGLDATFGHPSTGSVETSTVSQIVGPDSTAIVTDAETISSEKDLSNLYGNGSGAWQPECRIIEVYSQQGNGI
jgi:hypothetical protein